jgi:hypothetical protein
MSPRMTQAEYDAYQAKRAAQERNVSVECRMCSGHGIVGYLDENLRVGRPEQCPTCGGRGYVVRKREEIPTDPAFKDYMDTAKQAALAEQKDGQWVIKPKDCSERNGKLFPHFAGSETGELQPACIKYAEEELGYFVIHGNPATRTHRTPGEPDLCILMREGRVVWVELKVRGGAVSEVQANLHARMKNLGHRVEVVWSFEEFKEVVR